MYVQTSNVYEYLTMDLKRWEIHSDCTQTRPNFVWSEVAFFKLTPGSSDVVFMAPILRGNGSNLETKEP